MPIQPKRIALYQAIADNKTPAGIAASRHLNLKFKRG
jgi:hypothetical protein